MNEEKLFDQPIFIISLDTELIWGYVAHLTHKSISLMKKDDTKGRGCVDTLLNLFEKHNVPATWAIGGHLFLDHCECEDGVPHKDMPRFKEDWYSADPCTDIQRDPLSKDIVEKIILNRITKSAIILSLTLSFRNAAEKLPKQRLKWNMLKE